jgi:hypothetical protein
MPLKYANHLIKLTSFMESVCLLKYTEIDLSFEMKLKMEF